jgi:nicotinamide mononucleotide transporter
MTSLDFIVFEAFHYQVSALELSVFISGLVAVGITARGSVWGLVVGLSNIILSALFFYRLQLYSDFFLQGYYLITNIWGIWLWTALGQKKAIKPTQLPKSQWIKYMITFIVLTCLAAFITSNLHLWLPNWFAKPAALPWPDAAILAGSLVAQWLMAKRIIENWLIWIGVNALAIGVYGYRGVWLLAFLFFMYGLLALMGWGRWRKGKRIKTVTKIWHED